MNVVFGDESVAEHQPVDADDPVGPDRKGAAQHPADEGDVAACRMIGDLDADIGQRGEEIGDRADIGGAAGGAGNDAGGNDGRGARRDAGRRGRAAADQAPGSSAASAAIAASCADTSAASRSRRAWMAGSPSTASATLRST